MTNEIAPIVESVIVDLKLSTRDGKPWIKPMSDNTLSTASSGSLLSDLEECHCSIEDESFTPAATTSIDLDLRNEALTKEPAKKPSEIKWGNVDVRIFPIIPGDHPDCDKGPPLTIAWDHVEEFSVSIDAFEEEREGDRHHGNELILSWLTRQFRLRNLGFPEDELKSASAQAQQISRYREWTLSRIKRSERFKRFQESLMRKVGRGFRTKKDFVPSYRQAR